MSFDKPSGAKAKENLSKKIKAKKDKNGDEDPMKEWRDANIKDSEKSEYVKEQLRNSSRATREKIKKEEENDPIAIMREAQGGEKASKNSKEETLEGKPGEKDALNTWREGVSQSKFNEKSQGEAMQHFIDKQEGESKDKTEKEPNQDDGNDDKKEKSKQEKWEEQEAKNLSQERREELENRLAEIDALEEEEFQEQKEKLYNATDEEKKSRWEEQENRNFVQEKEAEQVSRAEEENVIAVEQGEGGTESAENVGDLRKNLEESQKALQEAIKKLENKKGEAKKFGIFKKILGRDKGGRAEIEKEREEFEKNYQEVHDKFIENSNNYYGALKEGGESDIAEIFADFNKRSQMIDKARLEAKDKKALTKACGSVWNWWKGRPKTTKILIGAGIAGGASVASGAALSVVLGVMGTRALKSALSGALAGAGMGIVNKKFIEKKGKDYKDDLTDKLKNNETAEDIYKSLELIKKKEKRNKRIAMGVIGGTVLAAGGAAYAWDDIMDYATGANTTGPMNPSSSFDNDWDLKKAMDTEKTGWEKVAESKTASPGKHSGDWQTYGKTPETETPEIGQEMPEVEDEFKTVHDVDNPDEELLEQLTKDDSNETPIIIEDGDKAAEEIMDHFKQKEGFEDGDTVWGKIKENLGTDEKETAKIYSQFKQDMTENLAKEHGMSAEQANKYIEWRMRHLNSFRGIKDTFDFNPDAKEFTVGGFADDKSIEFFNKLEEAKGGGAAEEVASKAKELGAEEILEEEEFKEDILNEKTAGEYAEKSVETDEGASQEETVEISESVGASENLEANLKRLEISEDSNAWKVASEMKLKDLMENVPNDQEQAWAMWRNNEVPLDMQKKLGMINGFYNYGRLIRLSQFITENNPSASDLEMTVEEYLKNKA